MSDYEINVGDKVQIGVYICGEWRSCSTGVVVQMSPDGTVSQVDIMSLHGGRPWIVFEKTAHLHKID